MRRWFIIALLAFLPVQFTWAAMASYCNHESGVQAQHMGHHDHQHEGESANPTADADATSTDAPTGKHLDCGHCHSGCIGMPILIGSALRCATSHPVAQAADLVPSHAQAPPERPQWLRLA
jgi:hypothetical protein